MRGTVTLAVDYHRDLGAGEHLLYLATEQHAGKPAAAVRGHENKIAFQLPRYGEDGVGREVDLSWMHLLRTPAYLAPVFLIISA